MITAIIMAAGESRRLHRPKQLVRFKGRTLLEHTIKCVTGSACEKIVVVVGAYKEKITETISSKPVEIIENNNWKEGKASSIRAGVNAIMSMKQKVKAIIILTCDQPYLTTAILDQMIALYYTGGRNIVACKYGNTVGVPAIIPQKYFSALLSLTNDQGAKEIIAASIKSTQTVEFPKGEIDIDRPDDIIKVISRQNENEKLSTNE